MGMRNRGASYIAGCSQTPQRLLQPPLSYDYAIDYTINDPFQYAIFQSQERQFDTIIDLAGGGWLRLMEQRDKNQPSIVKPASQGGRYLTLTPDQALFEAHSVSQAMYIFLWVPLWRAIKSRFF